LEEYLAGHRKDIRRLESVQQWLEKIGIHLHIIIQEDNNVVFGGSNPGIVPTRETHISRQLDNLDVRIVSVQEGDATITAAIIHHDDLMFATLMVDGLDYRREKLLKQMLTVPVKNNQTSHLIAWLSSLRNSPAMTGKWPVEEFR